MDVIARKRSTRNCKGRYVSVAEKSHHSSTTHEENSNTEDGQLNVNLDLFSTSAEYSLDLCSEPCINGAPFFAYKKQGKTYAVTQGCCNSWNCPRCGMQRAKQEYGRILEGCRKLAKSEDDRAVHTPIYFITITCKGKEITVNEAEKNYIKWCHRALDSWRAQAKRSQQSWCYCVVTERQKRGHPHSHILTNWMPPEIYERMVDKWEKDAQGKLSCKKVQVLGSAYLERSLAVANLGSQYDLSVARTVEGTARYVAKYLFKSDIFKTVWPKGWKRVRYSNSFPKLPTRKTDAFLLMRREDWVKLSQLAVFVDAKDQTSLDECKFWLASSDIIVFS